MTADVRHRLDDHLATWLGHWPPTHSELDIVTAPGRVEPGWDGKIHPVLGVSSPEGTVLSVPPDVVERARAIADEGGIDALGRRLGALLGRPSDGLHAGVFRWCDEPVPEEVLPDAGIWIASDDQRVAAWLRPFGGEVLVALVDGAYAAGVGIKRHDRFGWELAVGTEDRYAGRGLARRLVAQAARRVISEGMVPTYLHDPRNIASGKVADAAGFPGQGWKILGLWP